MSQKAPTEVVKTRDVLEKALGGNIIKMLYSENVKQKAKAYQVINKGISSFNFDQINKKERQMIQVALLTIINQGILDQNTQVNIYSINLLVNIIQSKQIA